ncbi:MAG: hypothetical protein K9L23_19900 [Desulfotignum sp.]|nr:hypothetical protein [Desulfotignum sp.]
MDANNLYLLKGKLTVQAKGYWFTSGGQKGSFGYYPHLKDANGYPIFPDTQIHGDLKMASTWLSRVDGTCDRSLVAKIFGGDRNQTGSSLLKVTDLRLKTRDHPEKLFEIKPRIKIDDTTRTVQKQMLASRELSFLEGQELEANLYLGYFMSEDEMQRAKDLVSASMDFLSGFGGFRSRGYGRGKVSVVFEQEETVTMASAESVGSHLPYMIKALVNFRSKVVDPGNSPQLSTLYHIPSGQFRAWFVNTYHTTFGQWPDFKDLATIVFPTLYPCVEKDFAWPAPMSTLKNETDRVDDLRGKDETERELVPSEENFFNTKTKGLGNGYYVTGAPAVSEKIQTEYRVRNSMNDRFITRDDGLFVQELVKQDTCFGGIIEFRAPGTEFSQQAVSVLNHVKPVIKGTLFAICSPEPTALSGLKRSLKSNAGGYLVTEPVNYNPERFTDRPPEIRETEKSAAAPDHQVSLDTFQSFNTKLGRPRRNRIMVAPGSVLGFDIPGYTIAWPGFGRTHIPFGSRHRKDEKEGSVQSSNLTKKEAKRVKSKLSRGGEWADKNWVITRSQAGLLRQYLHPGLDPEYIKQNLDERIEKYEDKSQETRLLKQIRSKLESPAGVTAMTSFITEYLDELAIYLFENKPPKSVE